MDNRCTLPTKDNPSNRHPLDQSQRLHASAHSTRIVGDLGRDALRGDGCKNLDFSLFKQFPIKERFRVEFRFEMFNSFNHPTWGFPDQNIQRRELQYDHIHSKPGSQAVAVRRKVLLLAFSKYPALGAARTPARRPGSGGRGCRVAVGEPNVPEGIPHPCGAAPRGLGAIATSSYRWMRNPHPRTWSGNPFRSLLRCVCWARSGSLAIRHRNILCLEKIGRGKVHYRRTRCSMAEERACEMRAWEFWRSASRPCWRRQRAVCRSIACARSPSILAESLGGSQRPAEILSSARTRFGTNHELA